ncbi:hypothetical protein [Actinorhabdospora filicis]|nr:hypothetical protein [Actinorhabdospora filicis]
MAPPGRPGGAVTGEPVPAPSATATPTTTTTTTTVPTAPAPTTPRRSWWERCAGWQSRVLGNLVEWSVVRTGGQCASVGQYSGAGQYSGVGQYVTGGEHATAGGLRVCREGRLRLHSKGGTTFGDVFVWDRAPADARKGLIAHETHHRDAQWRRYGWVFGFMYLWAHLLDVVVRRKCCNRYELAAERASNGGGGYGCLGKD